MSRVQRVTLMKKHNPNCKSLDTRSYWNKDKSSVVCKCQKKWRKVAGVILGGFASVGATFMILMAISLPTIISQTNELRGQFESHAFVWQERGAPQLGNICNETHRELRAVMITANGDRHETWSYLWTDDRVIHARYIVLAGLTEPYDGLTWSFWPYWMMGDFYGIPTPRYGTVIASWEETYSSNRAIGDSDILTLTLVWKYECTGEVYDIAIGSFELVEGAPVLIEDIQFWAWRQGEN